MPPLDIITGETNSNAKLCGGGKVVAVNFAIVEETGWSPVLDVLGRAAAEPQGSEAGAEFAHGSLLFMGGTEGGTPHGSTGAAGLGADPMVVVGGRVSEVWGSCMKYQKH